MKYAWTVAGDDPDYGQGQKHGITGYFFPAEDSVTTVAELQKADNTPGGKAIGVYQGAGWWDDLSPEGIAKRMNVEVNRLTKKNMVNRGLKVQFNLEEHDPERIAATLEAWRKLRPTTNTSWSPEGMQGGWMSPMFVARVLACRVRVVPQAFQGNMQRVESDAVLRNLTRRGFPESSVSIFYDAAQLAPGWDGFAFTMGRLPWLP